MFLESNPVLNQHHSPPPPPFSIFPADRLGWLGLWLRLVRQLLYIRAWGWKFDAAHICNSCDKLLDLLSSPSNTAELPVYFLRAAITDKSPGWMYGTNWKHWAVSNKELLLSYSEFPRPGVCGTKSTASSLKWDDFTAAVKISTHRHRIFDSSTKLESYSVEKLFFFVCFVEIWPCYESLTDHRTCAENRVLPIGRLTAQLCVHKPSNHS